MIINKITRSPHTSPRHSSSSREEKYHETSRKSSKESSSAYYDTRHSRSERGSGGQQRLSEARPQSQHKEGRYTDNNHLQPSRRAGKPHSQEVYDNRHKEGRRSSGRSEESTTATARNQRGSSQNRSQSKAEDGSGRRSDRDRESASTRHYRESTVSPQLRSSSEREVKFNLENHKTEARHYKQENNQPSEHSKRSTKSNLKSRSATAELRDKDPRSSSEREVRFSTEKPRRKEREHSKEYLLKSRTENRANNSNNRSSQSSSAADHSSGGRSSSERELKNLGGRSSSSDEHECCSASDCGALSCTSDCRQSSAEESSPFNKYEPKHGAAMIAPPPPLPPALPSRYSSSHSKTPSPISSTTSHMSNSIKETSPKPPIGGDIHPAAADDGSRKKVLIRSRSHDSIVEAEEDERRAQRRKADAESRKSRSAEECQPFYLHSPTHSGHQVPPPRNEYTTIQSLFYEIPERPTRYEGRKLMGQQPYVLESGGHKRRAAPPIPLPQGLFVMDILC